MKTGKQYPHTWKTGPDVTTHEQYHAWLKHKSQAAYRGEPHELSFQDWQNFWNQDNAWLQRGRRNTDLVLTRLDTQGSWSLNNCHVITRLEHSVKTGKRRLGRKYQVKTPT